MEIAKVTHQVLRADNQVGNGMQGIQLNSAAELAEFPFFLKLARRNPMTSRDMMTTGGFHFPPGVQLQKGGEVKFP